MHKNEIASYIQYVKCGPKVSTNVKNVNETTKLEIQPIVPDNDIQIPKNEQILKFKLTSDICRVNFGSY